MPIDRPLPSLSSLIPLGHQTREWFCPPKARLPLCSSPLEMSSQIHHRCISPISYVIFNAGKLALNINHPTLPCGWRSILYVTAGEKKEHIFLLHSDNPEFPEDGDNELITTITSLMERGRITVIWNVAVEVPPVHGIRSSHQVDLMRWVRMKKLQVCLQGEEADTKSVL